jgi:hypothetical protein
MTGLVFLITRSAKNRFLELIRKPSRLILWTLVIAGIVGIFLLSVFTRQNAESFADIIWLKGLLFLLVLLFLVIAVLKGLSSGDVIFDMNDVNFLFVSPVSPRLILMYGIVRMAKMAFLAGFFILFQSNSLSSGFGVGFGAVLILLLGFILAVCLLQIISLLIYSKTNGNPGRKRAVRLIAAAVFLPLLGFLGLQYMKNPDLVLALKSTLDSQIFSWTPVAGWASEGVTAWITGDIGNGLLFFGLHLLAGILLILYIALSNPDYYEDVLVATETTFEKKRSMAEGQVNMEGIMTRKVRITRTGIGGLGANAIFHKHLRESFRANRLGLWGLSSIILIAGSALISLFLRDKGGILLILQILMWSQIFLIGTGRGLKELYSHYIYMIPESSFLKIVWSNLEIMAKVSLESLFIFSVAGIITGEPLLLILAAIVVYILFSFLLLGINFLSLRWTGADISAGLLIFIYTAAVIIIMLPGIIAAAVIGSMFGDIGVLIGLGILSLWELITALGCFALSKGVLHRCDMPVMKTGR